MANEVDEAFKGLVTQTFNTYDLNSKGYLVKNEIQLLLEDICLDLNIEQVNEYQLNKIMKILDDDGNGTIEFEELCENIEKVSFILKLPSNKIANIVKNSFVLYDKGVKGYLIPQELRLLFDDTCANICMEKLTDTQFFEILSIVDENGDGRVDLEELTNNIMQINNVLLRKFESQNNKKGIAPRNDGKCNQNSGADKNSNGGFIKGLGKQIKGLEKRKKEDHSKKKTEKESEADDGDQIDVDYAKMSKEECMKGITRKYTEMGEDFKPIDTQINSDSNLKSSIIKKLKFRKSTNQKLSKVNKSNQTNSGFTESQLITEEVSCSISQQSQIIEDGDNLDNESDSKKNDDDYKTNKKADLKNKSVKRKQSNPESSSQEKVNAKKTIDKLKMKKRCSKSYNYIEQFDNGDVNRYKNTYGRCKNIGPKFSNPFDNTLIKNEFFKVLENKEGQLKQDGKLYDKQKQTDFSIQYQDFLSKQNIDGEFFDRYSLEEIEQLAFLAKSEKDISEKLIFKMNNYLRFIRKYVSRKANQIDPENHEAEVENPNWTKQNTIAKKTTGIRDESVQYQDYKNLEIFITRQLNKVIGNGNISDLIKNKSKKPGQEVPDLFDMNLNRKTTKISGGNSPKNIEDVLRNARMNYIDFNKQLYNKVTNVNNPQTLQNIPISCSLPTCEIINDLEPATTHIKNLINKQSEIHSKNFESHLKPVVANAKIINSNKHMLAPFKVSDSPHHLKILPNSPTFNRGKSQPHNHTRSMNFDNLFCENEKDDAKQINTGETMMNMRKVKASYANLNTSCGPGMILPSNDKIGTNVYDIKFSSPFIPIRGESFRANMGMRAEGGGGQKDMSYKEIYQNQSNSPVKRRLNVKSGQGFQFPKMKPC